MMQRLGCLLLLVSALTVQGAPASLALRPCKVPDAEETLRCGDLLVPENPAQPAGRQIKLHVVVVPALVRDERRAPLFELAGGPGLAVTDGASFYTTDGKVHRLHRDVVLVDQRGTGESSPLRCQELELTPSLTRMYPRDAVLRCRKTLERHADLSQYHTANTVADLEAVREALGYEQVDLFGLSYGTRLALAYIERVPARVRSAVLIGVVPADARIPLWYARNAQRTLEQLFADCAEDPACRTSYPELPEQWDRVKRNVSFDGPAREAFRSLLITTGSQRRLPLLIHSMSGGDFDVFVKRFAGSDSSAYAEGLYLSVICAEDAQSSSVDQRREATAGTFAGDYRLDEQSGACREWNVPAIRLTYGTRPVDVPILVLAGDRDYVTPLEWSRSVIAAFPRHRLVVIPKLGHYPDGMENMACLDAMMAAFYARASAADVDVSCVSTMKPPPFALPAASSTALPDDTWYAGPPFAVEERVFDENDLQGCSTSASEWQTVVRPAPVSAGPLGG